MTRHDDCPICRKLTRLDDLPEGEVVGQFPHSVVLLGPWQYYQGYCLVVARRHAAELSQLEDTERVAYFNEMCAVARAIEACFQPRKLNYELLGNQVPHLHWHLFPRYQHDPERLQPVWLALDRAERDPAEKQRLQMGPRERLAIARALQARLSIMDE